MDKHRPAIVEPILTELFHSGPALGEAQARLFAQRILTECEEALVFLFLEIARRLQSSAPAPSTPSGMIPPDLETARLQSHHDPSDYPAGIRPLRAAAALPAG